MQIKSNPKTGETSVKLTSYELRCLAMAKGICRTIAANSDGERHAAAQEVYDHLGYIIVDCIDQPAEAVMDPEQTGMMLEPAKKSK